MMMLADNQITNDISGTELSFDDFKSIVISDYQLAYQSRQASLLGRREVLTGKAKFGIFGDGKEIAQIAMSKVFQQGDWRSGYYRDQTFTFATGISTIKEFFAQLYANTDVKADPASMGRQMNCHFSTRILDDKGQWLNQLETKNTSTDVSTTGGQMARLLGLAYASKMYRQNKNLDYLTHFSVNGNEVAFGTIGNGSTSEGAFFETINAAGVLQVPMLVSVWDDGYGISVPSKYQTVKENISEVLKGFQREKGTNGIEIFRVNGWDYPALCEVYQQAVAICREEHVPVLIHVLELTQPQGHSTSGSHERYKSKERLAWEREHDCILKMKEWMLETGIASAEEIEKIENQAKKEIKEIQREAWNDFLDVIKQEQAEVVRMISKLGNGHAIFNKLAHQLASTHDATRREVVSAARLAIRKSINLPSEERNILIKWYQDNLVKFDNLYHSKLFTNSIDSPSNITEVAPIYTDSSKMIDGREILNACFDSNFSRDARLVAFGEDLGAIGDVNQGFAGLQNKYGELRVTDTGIRELSIIGQGLGMAIRGLRPIAEIQYLDYLLYGLTVLSDDLATLSYRSAGGQKAPLIVRTRGHRLEGIWHSGSPMSMILGSMRGVHVCVPRNMTQAAGMYNTLFRSDEPALVIECLNGYRLKEKLPENIGEFTVPIGKAEILKAGDDITIVSYGSTLRIVTEAAEELEQFGVNVEVIDVQTLLPFDKDELCVTSLKKTSKLLVVDEDVPGGASAYITQQILEVQNGYYFLDSKPRTLCAKEHRPPYGSDGDYFSKPSVDDVVELVYAMMNETNPQQFPDLM